MATTSRRAFLRAAAGLAALSVAACGATPTPTVQPSPTPTLARPAPATPPQQTAAAPTQPAASATPTLRSAETPTSLPAQAPATVTPTRQPSPPPAGGQAYLAVARGESPEKITRAAIAALGGMQRFVKPGNDVIVKPNICSASHPFEYAATTNPEVVGALVAMCREAGAKRVRVMDFPFSGSDGQAYAISGIEEAVKKAGGEMERMARMKFQDTAIAEGRDIKRWAIYHDVISADVLINVPIAKNHNLARLTLGMKNLMGIILDRSQLHYNLGQRLADLTSAVRPTLTVVDAVRILTQGGPTGGRLEWVKKMDTIIASHDVVASDAYAATLFALKGSDLDYIRAGAQMGLGRMDIDSVKIERIQV